MVISLSIFKLHGRIKKSSSLISNKGNKGTEMKRNPISTDRDVNLHRRGGKDSCIDLRIEWRNSHNYFKCF